MSEVLETETEMWSQCKTCGNWTADRWAPVACVLCGGTTWGEPTKLLEGYN